MASAAGAEGRRFDNINLLRAFAALSVVVYHVIELGKWTAYPMDGPLVTFRLGWYGVDLFFVISGFVIAYSALVLYRADPPSFARRYWLRRLTRIVPLYLLTLFAYLALFTPQWDAREWLIQIGTHLTFTHNVFIGTSGSIDGPNWSLGIEMQFYLAVALLIGWLDRVAAWKIAVAAIAVSWAWRAAMFHFYAGNTYELFVRVTQLPGTLDEFAAGIVLAKLLLDGKRNWFARGWPWVVAAIATGYLAMSVFWSRADYWPHAAMVTFWRTLLAVFFLCVVGAAIALSQQIADRWLKPLNYLGETSYGIYLWHLFAVNIVILQWGWIEIPALLAVVGITLGVAAISWQAFEKPFMRLARRRGPAT